MILELSPRPVALYDASVLYPSLIRNLLMYLGTESLVAARWTDTIHDEWTRNLHMAQPDLTPERLAHIRGLMERALPDAAVSGFESLRNGDEITSVFATGKAVQTRINLWNRIPPRCNI